MNARTSPRRPSAGFTLIEMVVALAILLAALALMMPDVGGWLRGLSVRTTAESIRAGVERARMEALRRNTSMSFWLVSDASKSLSSNCTLNASGASWVVSASNPAGKCDSSPSQTDEPMIVEKWSASEAPGSVEVQGLDVDGNSSSSVTFNSLGQVQGAGGLVRVDVTHSTPGVRALRVQVQAGGLVRLCDPQAAAGDPRRC